PASGRQDHTTSPSARSALSSSAPPASTASHRAFRDDREPPLLSGETGGFKSLIWPTAKAEYFFRQDWTGQISLKWFGKFDFARRRLMAGICASRMADYAFGSIRLTRRSWYDRFRSIPPSKARRDWLKSSSRFNFLSEHDLFGKPLHTFPDHA